MLFRHRAAIEGARRPAVEEEGIDGIFGLPVIAIRHGRCPFDCREGKGIFRNLAQSRGDKYECIVHICITLSDNRERVP
jgi:hypothetical protein